MSIRVPMVRSASVLTLTLLVLALAVQPALAGVNGGRGPCAGASVVPPAVHADPACLEADETYENSFNVKPVAHAVDVEVSWAYTDEEQAPFVEGFVIYRGASPATMTPIYVVGPEESSYTDEWGMVAGQAGWYAVEAVFADRPPERSAAYLVQVEA
ncbi:MAG: hypothetical protein R3185_00400 [Candidatus Thermoplasmatota archaeon]|nr:hypothetical protein [Candidatus Thermoplasmatota archaeon]